MSDTPFELLQLPPEATEEEIVRQGARLCQTATDDSRDAIREAVRLLTATEEQRRLHALLTPPAPATPSRELERFVAAHRRAPASEQVLVPELDRAEAAEIVRGLLLARVDTSPPALEPVPDTESEEEIARQASEATWHSLLYDMRG